MGDEEEGNMEKIKTGTIIQILCEVQPGPFSGERLITFETLDGPISGFVKENALTSKNGKWSIEGTIQSVEADRLVVKVRGSFFTTNGIANVSKEMAMAA
jgi:hypothetical protein